MTLATEEKVKTCSRHSSFRFSNCFAGNNDDCRNKLKFVVLRHVNTARGSRPAENADDVSDVHACALLLHGNGKVSGSDVPLANEQ